MTVEAKEEQTQMAELPAEGVGAKEEKVEEPKLEEGERVEGCEEKAPVEKNGSVGEERSHLSELKELEKKALFELRAKLEEAILGNKLFLKDGDEKKEKEEVKEKEKDKEEKKEKEEMKREAEVKEKDKEEKKEDEEEEEKENESKKEETKEKEVKENEVKESEKKEREEENECKIEEDDKEKEVKEKEVKEEEKKEEEEEKENNKEEEDKEKTQQQEEAMTTEAKIEEAVDKDISLWGVPLLPSKGSESTDVILLKFLRAREFKVKEAFEMLQKTLAWRKEFNIDAIHDDKSFEPDLNAACFMDGFDREGHPVCYNVYGVFQDDELYRKTFGTEEQREKFLMWRVKLMEKGIEKLDFKPGGVASLLQITDLKNSPGPAKKELRTTMKQAVELLQDNYPEFVARNIFVNVPFWYYAIHAILSPFLTQRTRSKFVFARPTSVTETLLKYIRAEDIPINYGGLKRENDTEFSVQDGVSELIIKAGSTQSIEIPAPEAGTTLLWDLTVLGWEVNYKEEFTPTDEGSYTIIVQKGKKIVSQEESIRNSFKNNEPGKVVLTIENTTYRRKKVLYRYKAKSS